MIIDHGSLQALFVGFKSSFNTGRGEVEPVFPKVVMTVQSSGSGETYGWLGALPRIRDWLGARVVNNLQTHSYTITNRKFELTVEVPRTSIEDDKIGVYSPMFVDMGRQTREHPDQLLAELIAAGTTQNCYDGQFFFDADHPVMQEDRNIVSVSNYQAGAGPTWYMLDLSRSIRPFIFQDRLPFELTKLDNPSDPNVFGLDVYTYGVRGRSNVGYGLWQLARASRAPLNAANFEAGRVAMASLRTDNGHKLGVRGTHLVVPAELEGDARRVLKNILGPNGESNPWVAAAEIIVSPWL